MKKIFAFCLFLLAGTSVFAQTDISTDFQFCDENGNIIENGTVLTRTDVEENPFGSVDFDNLYIVHSGLYAKKTNEASNYYLGITYTINSISGGSHQICFPITCISENAAGTYETGKKQLDYDVVNDMQTEWLTANYGSCSVTYTMRVYRAGAMGTYTEVAEGPTVTVNYYNNDPAGIETTEAGKTVVSTTYYDLSGSEVSTPAKGVYIKKSLLSDGTFKTVKVIRR